MYAKLFGSILDSSVWLQPLATRIVWLTLLAAKDQDGFARFATIENLASRARVSLEDATAAIAVLESPDANSSNPEHDGRRIERVPGGWLVLNATIYDAIAKRENEREQTRERVRRYRAKDINEMAAPTPTWLTPICDVYERYFGAGSFPYGKAGRTLKPLHERGHSGENIAARLDRYIEQLDNVRYFSLAKFRETFDAHSEAGTPKKTTPADDIGNAGLLLVRIKAALIEHRAPQGTSYGLPNTPECLTYKAAVAAIGGPNAIARCQPEQWTFLVRNFASALKAAGQ